MGYQESAHNGNHRETAAECLDKRVELPVVEPVSGGFQRRGFRHKRCIGFLFVVGKLCLCPCLGFEFLFSIQYFRAFGRIESQIESGIES